MASTRDARRAQPVVVIGAGRVGKALVRALVSHGVAARVVPRRSLARRDLDGASQIILAVRDPQIAEVAAELAPRIARGTVVLHCAGRFGAEVLSTCRARGAATGQFHPLLSFAGRIPDFHGATVLVRGDAAAVRLGRKLSRTLGAIPRDLPGLDPRAYHAGAAIFANGVVALAAIYASVLEAGGLRAERAMALAAPLGESVLENLVALGPERALTGPVRRGDAAATRALLDAARGAGNEAFLAVRGLAGVQILLASAAGDLDEDTLDALRRVVGARPVTEASSKRSTKGAK